MEMLGVELVSNHADFRLLSREAMEALKHFGEVNLFLRGLMPLLGHRQELVYYKREPRHAGVTKYNVAKLTALAIDSIISFSTLPLRLITILGLCVSLVAFGSGVWSLVMWYTGTAIPGWTSIVLPMYLLGGVQLVSIGILGEYIGKSYFEAKKRPRYLIEKSV
jgi:hypothetical protein